MSLKSKQSSKFFLPEDEVRELAREYSRPPSEAPDGSRLGSDSLNPEVFSKALQDHLLRRFSQAAEIGDAWVSSQPIALGSWARDELCPRSDVDLIFAGEESAAAKVTAWAQENGLRIRSRTPESHEDWSKGVEVFDVLALMDARPLVPEAQVKLAMAQERLGLVPGERVSRGLKTGALKTLKAERLERNRRYDSIEGYLEPNLKYGPGGLRDLHQARLIRKLFVEKFVVADHASEIYQYFSKFFLLVRQRLHLAQGAGDIISAYEQGPISEWLGYANSKDFMREVQKGLSRVAFYADVDFARAVSRDRIMPQGEKKLTFEASAKLLRTNPSVINQWIMREWTEKPKRGDENLAKLLKDVLDPAGSDQLAVAFFRSRLFDFAVTDFRRIVGYVQHDQYHRYPVDTHLLQAIRELKKVHARPTILGRLKKVVNDLTATDWKILGWAALYHDIGKGKSAPDSHENGGQHSDHSVEIAKSDLKRFGLEQPVVEEVLWLIENHLVLSHAAFRGNSRSPAVWRSLQKLGVEGARLKRLAVFTAIDIRATNREAYTPWKERLLAELVELLTRPEALNLGRLQVLLKGRADQWGDLLERLDPFLVGAVNPKVLANDLVSVAAVADQSLSVRCMNAKRDRRFWIRFYQRLDRPGLFAEYTRAIQTTGLSVRHASVHSDPELGVYDWFEVKPPQSATAKTIETRLQRILSGESREHSPSNPSVAAIAKKFESIEVISEDEKEWVVSFRGPDFRGALLEAATRLMKVPDVSIVWAKVHTWGRQIDDVFGVTPPKGKSRGEFEALLKS